MKHRPSIFFKKLLELFERSLIILKRLEFVLAGVAFLALYLILANYALGGPLSSDVMGYMNAGMHNTKSTYVLNRYFHILLEKIFLEIAPNPIVGAQHYWAFLIAGTVFLIYVGARLFSEKSTVFHALLAIGVFFSISAIGELAGIPLVDVPAMFMVALLITLYVLSVRKEHKVPYLMVVWGGVFYLALRTKETTLAASILLIGFGVQEGKVYSRILFRNLALVAAGFLAGVVIFAIWNGVVLHDFLFGLRVSDIEGFLKSYVKNAQSISPSGSANWYDSYIFSSLLLPFLFYLISSLKLSDIDLRLRLVWGIPLVLLFFLIVTTHNEWGFRYRVLMPAFPAISLVSPQFLVLRGNSTRANLRLTGILFLGLLTVFALRAFLRIMAPLWGWDIVVLMTVKVEPIILTLFLLIAILGKASISSSVLLTVLMIFLLVTPVRRNYKVMFIQRPNWERSQRMFYPFSAFEDELQYRPDIRLYFSLPVWETLNVSVINERDEVIVAYNVYFDSWARLENFHITSTTDPQILLNEILAANYTGAVIRVEDWQNIQDLIKDDPQTAALLAQKYEVIPEPKHLLILLKSSSP